METMELRHVPPRYLRAHLRKLPPMMHEGQSVTTRHFDGDPDFDYEYGEEFTVKTTCSNGRLSTMAGSETHD